MSFAHLTLPTPHVEATAHFLESVFGYTRLPTPANSPSPLVWLDLGHGQELHVLYVEGCTTSPFEAEFGATSPSSIPSATSPPSNSASYKAVAT